jgi:hypothetical protein
VTGLEQLRLMRFERGDRVELPKRFKGSRRGIVAHSGWFSRGETCIVQRIGEHGEPVQTVILADELYRLS